MEAPTLSGGLPAIIDHDSTFYLRQQDASHLLFGGFETLENVKIKEDWYKGGVPRGEGFDDTRYLFDNCLNEEMKSCGKFVSAK